MLKKNLKPHGCVMALTLAVCLFAAGCGNPGQSEQPDPTPTVTTQPDRPIVIGGNPSSDSDDGKEDTNKDFVFIHNNIKIKPNDLVDPLVAALGSDYAYYESPSCAYTGLDKCYVYKGFSIYTYPDDKAVDHVLQVVLTDDTLSTPEGLIIGDTAEKVKELYGTDYAESNGSFAYTRGKTSLMIIMKNDRVLSIQYTYTDSLQ